VNDTSSAPANTRILTFPEGIAGFADARSFTLADLDEEGTFQLFDCLERPELSMVVCVPWLLFPDYAPEVDEATQAALGLSRAEDAIVFCSVTVEPEDEALYCNLLGPFVVNAATLEGRQVVQHDLNLPVRASVPLAS
jgi:flagellar assembly factor FliW